MRSPAFTILGAFVLSAAFAIAAQAQAPTAQSQSTEVTIQGCIQTGAGRMTLTDQNGTTYLLDYASPSPQKLAFVEVRGVQFPPQGQQPGEDALPKVRVTTMRRLSATCPANITPPPATSKAPTAAPESPSTPAYESPINPPAQEAAPVLNTQGAGGAPSPGTGNPPDQPTEKK